MKAFKVLYARLRSAGICPDDSEEVRLKKVVLLFACGLMIAAAALWLALYQALGLPVSASWPVAFQLGSLATLAYSTWSPSTSASSGPSSSGCSFLCPLLCSGPSGISFLRAA